MRILLPAIGLLLAAVWYVPAMVWGYNISAAFEQMRNGAPEGVARLADLAGGPAPVRWWTRHARLNDTFNTTYLSDARGVRVRIEMPFAALLAPDEAAPAPDFASVYAAARAPGQLIRLCPELLHALAVKCDVAKPHGEIGKDGQAVLSGTLRFVPAEAPGTLAEAGDARIVQFRARLRPQVALPFTAEVRETVLREAAALCRVLRTRIGNCVVTGVSLAPARRSAPGGDQLLDAGVTLGAHGVPAALDRRAIGDALSAASPLLRF